VDVLGVEGMTVWDEKVCWGSEWVGARVGGWGSYPLVMGRWVELLSTVNLQSAANPIRRVE
jgi:hypothetical protein